MGIRPLRQFYGHDRRFAIDGLPAAANLFRRHRDRLLDALGALGPDQWSAMTRCQAWNAKDVANHLVSADGFWALTIKGRGQTEPTAYLRGFDPSSTPDAVIALKREQSSDRALQELTQSTEQLLFALEGVGDDEWSLVGESPFGHVPVSVIAAHAFWDSWLHERDVMLPLGREPAAHEDELLTSTAFSLFLSAQGGVLDDGDAVADGPEEAISTTLTFDDLPGRSIAVRVDRDVVVEIGQAGADAVPAGAAVSLVEAVAGRTDRAALDRLPAELAAQLRRAGAIL